MTVIRTNISCYSRTISCAANLPSISKANIPLVPTLSQTGACILTILRLGFELFFLVPHTYDFANINIPSIQLPPSILVTLKLFTILRLGFELFFLVLHTYQFANINIPSIQLPPSILVTFRLGIVSFLFYSLVPPPRPHYRSFNTLPTFNKLAQWSSASASFP